MKSKAAILTCWAVLFMVIPMLAACENPTEEDSSKKDSPKKDSPKKDSPKKDSPKKDSPENEKYLYPKEIWGEWIQIDTGYAWRITGNALSMGSTVYSYLTLKQESTNVIKVTENKREYWLFASRTPKSSFSGKVVKDDSSSRFVSRSMSGLGGANVTISNLKDKTNTAKTKTDLEGNFTADGIIAGDEYEVTVDGKTVPVTPNTDGDNIGTVTVTNGVNFKTTITASYNDIDMMRLYTATTKGYNVSIVITNVGTEDCLAASYSLRFDDGLSEVSKSSSLSGRLGTIEPGKTKTIPIEITCAQITNEFEYKTIGVTVTDTINNKTWDDSVSLKFNREHVTFNIAVEHTKINNWDYKEISGVLIVPGAKTYRFTAGKYGLSTSSITVPKYYAQDYFVVFLGANANTEAAYSLGIGVSADSNFSGFLDMGNYEPNNSESQATQLGVGKITSYLHKNDIDYYRINFDQ